MKLRRLFIIAGIAALAASGFAAAKRSQELELIRAGLKDSSREIRQLSAQALGAVGDKSSVPALKEMLSDPNDSLKITVAVALAKLGDRAGIAEIRKILKNVPQLSDNPKPLERVKAIAKGTVRAQAARELGNLKDIDSIELLKIMIDDEDGRVADASLIALAKMGDPAGKKEFISALESTKQEVRAKAAEALGEIGDQNALEPLRKRLKDWDKGAKAAAVLALGKLKDKQSAPVIREMLWDKEDVLKENAAQALGYMGITDVAPAIEELLKDKNGFVRFAAVEALYRLGQDSGKQFVLDTLKADEKDAKLRALNILEKTATAKDIPLMEPLVSNPDREVSITAAKAIVTVESRENAK